MFLNYLQSYYTITESNISLHNLGISMVSMVLVASRLLYVNGADLDGTWTMSTIEVFYM